ncbi:hypothetical protein COCMIDRAFT_41724 [Bipolaris oryzae ATCC 44560]|uniref:Uncharacterized protein n=1 Tax=Bipolaris oryzae ATCC 44560 TaxID=930090 RepID=W6Z827_COCMI|nr:uncharacterized protein COCMIDRAFT_41724 [Bipolaris oryzae ATCC 44560]EUC39846.1 hypothetical protein COCMIDRAFT_41724 [Bipolaris oryzae ATCC 44560]
MSSQDTIPDDTLYQSGNKSKEQPGKFTSRETKEAASHTNAKRKPEESHTEVVDFLEELKNIKGQLEHTLGNVEDLVSRLQEATEQHTHKTLPMSGKLVRWADSTGTYSAKHDIHRARKKALPTSDFLVGAYWEDLAERWESIIKLSNDDDTIGFVLLLNAL